MVGTSLFTLSALFAVAAIMLAGRTGDGSTAGILSLLMLIAAFLYEILKVLCEIRNKP